MRAYDAFELAAKAVWPSDAPISMEGFVEEIEREGSARYRDLPWRNLTDAYAVLVSEVMLQQTQVKRVLVHWERFLDAFPTLDDLARARVGEVVALWQGLGYNRRALALKRCAEECVRAHGGKLPETADELIALPGIGQATAAGVVAFAYDRPSVYLETNVRTVLLHRVFPEAESVDDKLLAPLAAATCIDRESPRAWYYALLDFGAYLKTQVGNPSRRSAQYTRQSAFEGSRRQKRAELVRIVLANPGITLVQATARLSALEVASGRKPVDVELASSIAADLAQEGFFRIEGDRFIP